MLLTTNTSITVKRLPSWATREYSVIVTSNEPAFIEPADDAIKAIYDGAPGGEMYRIFTDFMDVAQRDMIEAWGKKYKVEGVKVYDCFIDSHLEIIVRDNDNS